MLGAAAHHQTRGLQAPSEEDQWRRQLQLLLPLLDMTIGLWPGQEVNLTYYKWYSKNAQGTLGWRCYHLKCQSLQEVFPIPPGCPSPAPVWVSLSYHLASLRIKGRFSQEPQGHLSFTFPSTAQHLAHWRHPLNVDWTENWGALAQSHWGGWCI